MFRKNIGLLKKVGCLCDLGVLWLRVRFLRLTVVADGMQYRSESDIGIFILVFLFEILSYG